MIEIYNTVKEWLESLGDFQAVDRYKGEFDEGADWNPVFPACFIRLDSVKPRLTDAQGMMLMREYVFSLYAAAQDTGSPTALDIIESLWNPTITDVNIRDAEITDCNWLGYFSGVEVYRIELTISAK